MGKLSDEIMADLGKKKASGGSMDMTDKAASGADDEGAEGEGEDSGYGGDEVSAMQDFEDASGPEEKASAMRAFLEVCVPKIVNSMK